MVLINHLRLQKVHQMDSEPGIDLIPGYSPFIADVGQKVASRPFEFEAVDDMTEEELKRRRRHLDSKMLSKRFDPPLPLSDFCLIAEARWKREKERDEDGCKCSVE